jgi:hypothetical protein
VVFSLFEGKNAGDNRPIAMGVAPTIL